MSTSTLRYYGNIVFTLDRMGISAGTERTIDLDLSKTIQWSAPYPPDHIRNSTYGNLYKEMKKYQSSFLSTAQTVNFFGQQRNMNRTDPGIFTWTTKYDKVYDSSDNTDRTFRLTFIRDTEYDVYEYKNIKTETVTNIYPTSIVLKLEKVCSRIPPLPVCSVSLVNTGDSTFTLNLSVNIPCGTYNVNEPICGATGGPTGCPTGSTGCPTGSPTGCPTGSTGCPTGNPDETGQVEGFDINKNWWIILVVVIGILVIVGIILLILWRKGIIFVKKPKP